MERIPLEIDWISADEGGRNIVSGQEPIFYDPKSGTYTIEDVTQLCPFATIGETTKFREPWQALFDGFPHYQADFEINPESEGWLYAKDLPDKYARLSGKCVKVEARQISGICFDEMMDTGLISKERFDLAYEDYMDGDLDAIPELRLAINLDLEENDWAWFATFERA